MGSPGIRGDTIDRVCSGEESDNFEDVKRLASSSAVPTRIQAMLDKVKEMTAHQAKEKDGGEDEPTSIFGFVCGANVCGVRTGPAIEHFKSVEFE